MKHHPLRSFFLCYSFLFLLTFPFIGTSCAANVEGLGGEAHSPQDIINYLSTNTIHPTDEVHYDTLPSLAAPYEAGTLSQSTQNDALTLLNNVRYIAGLSPVSYSTVDAVGVQATALLSAVNGSISHNPRFPAEMPSDLYALAHQYAGRSNLAAGNLTLNDAILNGWIYDSDSSNLNSLGHRRWCLNPQMKETAFGAVTNTGSGYSNYYAMYAFNCGLNSDIHNIAWPSTYTPLSYFKDNSAWSISLGADVIASATTVQLTRLSDNQCWHFCSTPSLSDGYFNVNNELYGQTGCIIFRPNDITYQTNDKFSIHIQAGERVIDYTVTFFDLAQYQHTLTHSLPLQDATALFTSIISTLSVNHFALTP